MFWKTAEAQFMTAGLAQLLDKPDVTLLELMDDEYILQEVKFSNKRMMDYLTKEEHLIALTKLCVTEPRSFESEWKKYKYSHLASEIICAGSAILTAALAQCAECYKILADFVRPNDHGGTKSLNPLLASFFNKVFILLVSKHADQVLAFMQNEPTFLDNLIANLDTSALGESLFRLACGGDNEKQGRAIKNWLAEYRFIQKLIKQLDASKTDETHQSVTFLLIELIRALRRDQFARDDDPSVEEYMDPLVVNFESRQILDDLLDRMLSMQDQSKYSDSVTTSGCSVFLELLRTLLNPRNPLRYVDDLGKFDPQRAVQAQEDDLLKLPTGTRPPGIMWEPDANRIAETCLAERLNQFQNFLERDVKMRDTVLLPMGKLDDPVGSARLAVTQLLAQMLANGSIAIHEGFVKLNLIGNLIDMFFKYKWNNFLHTNVVNCIVCALYGRLGGDKMAGLIGSHIGIGQGEVDEFGEKLESKSSTIASPLLKEVLESYHLLKMLVDKHSEIAQLRAKDPKSEIPSYMGHIKKMAVCVYYAMKEGPNVSDMRECFMRLPSEERDAWNRFVDTYLLAYIKRNEPDQVGAQPSRDSGIMTDRMEDLTDKESTKDDIMELKRPLSAKDFLKDEQMDEAAFEAMCVDKQSISSASKSSKYESDVWAEKEIMFESSQQKSGFGDVFAAPERSGGDDWPMSATRKKKTSSSDEEDEKMDVGKDDAPTEWFSSAKSSTASSANWASFEEADWPSSNATTNAAKSSQQSGQDDWAIFDQAKSSSANTSSGIGNALSDDMWPPLSRGQPSSSDRSTAYQKENTNTQGHSPQPKST